MTTKATEEVSDGPGATPSPMVTFLETRMEQDGVGDGAILQEERQAEDITKMVLVTTNSHPDQERRRRGGNGTSAAPMVKGMINR